MQQCISATRTASGYTKAVAGRSPRRRELSYWAGLLAGRVNAAETRLFGLAETMLERRRQVFDLYKSELLASRHKLAKENLKRALFLQASLIFGSIVAFKLPALPSGRSGVIGTAATAQASLSFFGNIAGISYAFLRFHSLAVTLGQAVTQLTTHWKNVAYTWDLINMEIETAPSGSLSPPQRLQQGIVFHDVSFTYPGADKPALNNVNLSIRPCERIALVGENGAGRPH